MTIKEEKKRSGVLADHRRIGKRFVPPFLDRLPVKETSWVTVTLPEVIWIACLHQMEGLQRGTALAASLSESTIKSCPDIKTWFAAISCYEQLSTEQRSNVVTMLAENGDLLALQRGLHTFCYFYPAAPLGFIFPGDVPAVRDHSEILQRFKNYLLRLYDKTTREATMLQGTVIYLAGLSGRFRIPSQSNLAELPKLEEYPLTEQSKWIAAEVRSAISVMLRPPGTPQSLRWANYFWNRGFELEACNDPF